MNETDIRKYANLMQELGLTGLEITDDKKVVRLERNVTEQIQQIVPVAAGNSGVSQTVGENVDADYISVKSPIVGVFYAASAESADPYVAVGDHVSKGQTLCIIEAMKLMNEIESEFDGEVAEIFIKDGEAVEYGKPLFKII